jgi:cold shock protein
MGRKGARGAGLRERAEPSPIEELLKELTANRVTQGKVKYYNQSKGYGFIEQSGGGDSDIFFHVSALDDEEIKAGQQVSYRVGKQKDGRPIAERVKAIRNNKEEGRSQGAGQRGAALQHDINTMQERCKHNARALIL